jgi:hypothetical protein
MKNEGSTEDSTVLDGIYKVATLLAGARALARQVHAEVEGELELEPDEDDYEDVARLLDIAIGHIREVVVAADAQRHELTALRADTTAKMPTAAEIYETERRVAEVMKAPANGKVIVLFKALKRHTEAE